VKFPAVAPLGMAAAIVLPEPNAPNAKKLLEGQPPIERRPPVALIACVLRSSAHTVGASREILARGDRAGADIPLLAHGIICTNNVFTNANSSRGHTAAGAGGKSIYFCLWCCCGSGGPGRLPLVLLLLVLLLLLPPLLLLAPLLVLLGQQALYFQEGLLLLMTFQTEGSLLVTHLL